MRPFSYKIAQQKREHKPIINTVQQGATPHRRPIKQVSLPAALHNASGRVSARVESKAKPSSNSGYFYPFAIVRCRLSVSLFRADDAERPVQPSFGQITGFGAELLDFFHVPDKQKEKSGPQFCSARQVMGLSLG